MVGAFCLDVVGYGVSIDRPVASAREYAAARHQAMVAARLALCPRGGNDVAAAYRRCRGGNDENICAVIWRPCVVHLSIAII
jgi:hypothetical protein